MGKYCFIPGKLAPPTGPLARYRPAQPRGAVEAYVRGLSEPGDLVVDLFCQGPQIVREAVEAGRRALGISVNPLLLLIARLGLGQCEAHSLNAAFTYLADERKGDVPLRHYLNDRYRSPCPTCEATGVAEWLAWEREGDRPFWKAVRCPRCDGAQEGPAVEADVKTAHQAPPRGLAYYYALDRVAPRGHPGRERAAQLLELYTPRNLSALMDLAMRLDGLDADQAVKLALTGALLDCFDRGSSLDPYGEERARPRTLRVPAHYIERNVWLSFEDGVSCSSAVGACAPVQRVDDADALLAGEAEGYTLISHAARDVRQRLPAQIAALIFVDPPRPDGVFWALSALWAGWLWETPAALALRPYLRRRRFDWDWHGRVLKAALRAAGPLLAPGGYLITLSCNPEKALLASTCVSASGSGYTLAGWGYEPDVGYRLIWRWTPDAATGERLADDVNLENLAHDLSQAAGEAAIHILHRRAEPTETTTLTGGVYGDLTERGALARTAASLERAGKQRHALSFVMDAIDDGLDAAPLVDIASEKEARFWLAAPRRTDEPLADRVERAVWELLAHQSPWPINALIQAIYARFPGQLTPDLALALTCIDSYGAAEGETVRLRPEDAPLQRNAELDRVRESLVILGERLGFKPVRGGSWDVRWLDRKADGREQYVFDVTAEVSLGDYLFAGRTVDEGAQRRLVIPGGRAALVDFKLRRDPRLPRLVEAGQWQFIKFRHLRRLLAQPDLDRYAFQTVSGLDPIVEQEAAQIPLF